MMKIRGLLLAFVLTLSAHASNNVLLIIADDLGLDASVLYNTASGAQLALTPNIASLAANGVQFTNAYSCPLCSPARSSILTGRQGFRTGTANVVGGGTSNNALKAAEFTLPDAFAASGLNYQLKHIGKWHLGGANTAPCQIGGWPSFSGAMLGEVTDFSSWAKVTGSGATASSSNCTTYATTDNVNDALAFISTQTAAGKPWFTWLAFNAPHIPYHKPPVALLTSVASKALSGTTTDIAANPRNYFNASIEAMDTEMGRLLAGVDLAKTTVIFIGDNGTEPNVLQTPYPGSRGKATLYEGGIRVPLIIRGPDVVSPGRVSNALTHVTDLYATILELAGIHVVATLPVGTVLDSKSLLPVIENRVGTRSQVFNDYFDLGFPSLVATGRSLRDSQYKLIRLKSGADLFYDLMADPYEATNLISATMSATRQTAYNSLITQLGNYNTPPTISTLLNQNVAPSTATNALPVTVGDAELSTSILMVSATSSNTTLLPTANLLLGGSDASRTLKATPAVGQIGASTITLSVTDGVFTTSSSFVLTVGPPAAVILPILATVTAGSSNTLSWAGIAGATSYTVEMASSANFSTGLLASQTVTNPTAIFNSLTNGLIYYYRVRSNNSSGSSAYSNTVSSAQDTSLRTIPLSLVFKATVGTSYTLQYSPDMMSSSWTDIGWVISDGNSANFTETNATRLAQLKGFYRVITP